MDKSKFYLEYDPCSDGYIPRVIWPLISLDEPRLMPGPGELDGVMDAISFLILQRLNKTIEAHCRNIGADKGEWVRYALMNLLSQEQRWLERIGITRT